jgi:hypothetical protein
MTPCDLLYQVPCPHLWDSILAYIAQHQPELHTGATAAVLGLVCVVLVALVSSISRRPR